MDTKKSMFQSKTMLGLFITVVGAIVPAIMSKFGFTFTDVDTQDFVDLGSKLTELVGVALAFYGRIKATKKLT